MIGGLLGYGAAGASIALAIAVTSCSVQTGRLNSARSALTDMTKARDDALTAQVNPASGVAWAEEFRRSQTALGTCTGNVTTLQGAVERQGAAVRAAEAEAARVAAASATASERASLAVGEANRRAAAILARRPGADACQSALELLRNPP